MTNRPNFDSNMPAKAGDFAVTSVQEEPLGQGLVEDLVKSKKRVTKKKVNSEAGTENVPVPKRRVSKKKGTDTERNPCNFVKMLLEQQVAAYFVYFEGTVGLEKAIREGVTSGIANAKEELKKKP